MPLTCGKKSENQDTGSHDGDNCDLHFKGELNVPKDVRRENCESQIVERVERLPGMSWQSAES